MIEKIVKRDGRCVEFKLEKIADAIYKAAKSIGGSNYDTAYELAGKVAEIAEIEFGKNPSVEDVQDIVERVLMGNGHARTAKKYILYRNERTRSRSMNSSLMKTFEDLTFKNSDENDIKRENANVNGDTAMGTMLKYGSEGAKSFYDVFILDPVHSKAHREGDIHIHDLDFYTLTTTCCQIDLTKLFSEGFSTGHGHLRPPNDIRSYAALACIAIQSNQNDQHGGQSVPSFDYDMAEGVRKTYKKEYRNNLSKAIFILVGQEESEAAAVRIIDEAEKSGIKPLFGNDNGFSEVILPLLIAEFGEELGGKIEKFATKYAKIETEKATLQAMEAFVHNLNTMNSRAGSQTPFSSINYGTDLSHEGRLVTKAVLTATERGLGNGETSIFPIHIFKVKEGVNYNEDDPNYDLFKQAVEVSAKRLFPNFSFLDSPFNAQYYKAGKPESEVAYMGCRTRVIANAADKDREIVTGRGNLSFTSINLPRIALKANKDIDFFFEELDRKLDLVFEQLIHRFKIQATKTPRNFPFLMGQGIWMDSDKLGPDDKIEEVIKHGTLTVGFIGLAETLKSLIGKHHGESTEAQNLGLEIVNHLRSRCDREVKKTGLNFSLIATPAEGLSGRFIRMDKDRYGKLDGITDRDYYTNSFHIPVYYDVSAYDKIKLEAPYHALTNGGHISYVEIDGNPSQNIEAFMAIVRLMKENGIGYGSINHPVDRDPVCGYTGIIGDVCPRCGRRDGEGVPISKLQKLGLYKDYNSDNIGYSGDKNEEGERRRRPNFFKRKGTEE